MLKYQISYNMIYLSLGIRQKHRATMDTFMVSSQQTYPFIYTYINLFLYQVNIVDNIN